jgi:hypothetical protein
MEITSKPTALDEVDRRVLQLEMERLSLTKAAAKDKGAAARWVEGGSGLVECRLSYAFCAGCIFFNPLPQITN